MHITPLDPEKLTIPLVFIGPSGSGKSTAVKLLASDKIVSVQATWTDREMRPGEEELEHIFVDSTTFRIKERENHFLEVVRPFDLEYRYGLPELLFCTSAITLVMLRARFISLFNQYYPDNFIYHIEAPIDRVEAAVLSRGTENIGSRLAEYESECSLGRKIASRVFMNDGTIETLMIKILDAIGEDFGASSTSN